MKSLAANTFLVITATRLWRADVDAAGGTVQGLWQSLRPAGTSLADSVRAALLLGGKPGRSVLVLTTEAWTQSLTLHKGQISGLTPDQIARALAFESEPFSDLSASEAETGFADSGMRDGTAGFWITQISRSERDAVQRALKETGHRFAGIGHPGGMPAPLAARSGEAWRRMEIWDGAMIMVACEDGRHLHIKVLSSFPDPGQMPSHGAFELLNGQAAPPVLGRDDGIAWQRFSLSEEAHARSWLLGWVAAIGREASSVPLIAPAAPPPTSTKYVLTCALIQAAVIILIVFQLIFQGIGKRVLQEQLRQHEQAAQAIKLLEQESAQLTKELDQVNTEARLHERIAIQRRALPVFLAELSALRTQDLVIRSIKPVGGALVVAGLSLEAAAVDELGIALTKSLAPVQLVAQPLQKRARRALPNDGPWEFSLSIMPTELAAKSNTAAMVPSGNN